MKNNRDRKHRVRQVLAHFTLACALMTLAGPAQAQFSGSGSGTSSDPYLIFTATQLNQMRNAKAAYYQLMADIDIADWIDENTPTEGWNPVGNASEVFSGTLDGNGYTISGLWINRSSTNYIGLFGYISGATIQDLTIEAGKIVGAEYVGTLAGYVASSTLTNLAIKADELINSGNYTGGIAGYASASSFSDVDLQIESISGASYIGGCVGYVEKGTIKFTSCLVEANIYGESYIGGIVGAEYRSTSSMNLSLTNCETIVNIQSDSGDCLGGLLGYMGVGKGVSSSSYIKNI